MSEVSNAKSPLSRRQFGTVAGIAAVAAGTPVSAMAAGSTKAAEVTERTVSLSTPNGAVNGYFVHPVKGSHPGVLAWRGGNGLNVASRNEARTLATQGYSVLVLDRDGGEAEPVESDAASAVEWLEGQTTVDEKRVGTPEWANLRIEEGRARV